MSTTKVFLQAFYKGSTIVEWELKQGTTFKEVHKTLDYPIVLGLREGLSINEIKEVCQAQLDLMEKSWFESEYLFGNMCNSPWKVVIVGKN